MPGPRGAAGYLASPTGDGETAGSPPAGVLTVSSIRAVFWDFGGVITSSPFENFRRYEREHGLPENFLRETNAANHDHNAWAKLERSEIDLAEFDRLFLAETTARGHAVPGRVVLPLLAGQVRPWMVEVLRRVKARYRIACLTNNIATGFGPGMGQDENSARGMAKVLAMFEFVLESSRAGVRKPDPRFYEIACERMGVQPADVVFLDDLGVNLKPAKAMGMTTIKFDDPRRAIGELAGVLGLELAP